MFFAGEFAGEFVVRAVLAVITCSACGTCGACSTRSTCSESGSECCLHYFLHFMFFKKGVIRTRERKEKKKDREKKERERERERERQKKIKRQTRKNGERKRTQKPFRKCLKLENGNCFFFCEFGKYFVSTLGPRITSGQK